MTQDQVLQIFRDSGALLEGHFILRSGLHSRQFFQCALALQQMPVVEKLGAALAAIHDAGGGLIEAYPEQVEGRAPQRGAYFHTGPADLFEEFGFERDRKIAKWRWVMRLRIRS